MEYPDHGAISGSQVEAVSFMYSNNILAFIIFIIAIITSEFWFEFFHQILREITGRSEPNSIQMLTFALIFTFIFFLVVIYIYKIPTSAAFTL